MDESEVLVDRYLNNLGHSPTYEPDGNIPPDFLLEDGKTAIEVRRLNQNFNDGQASKGLEEVSISLDQKMKELLNGRGPPTERVAWTVSYKFHRPLPEWKTIKREVEAAIAGFDANPKQRTDWVSVVENFHIKFLRNTSAQTKKYCFRPGLDFDRGGFTVSEIIDNLELCVAEKTQKVSPYRAKYPNWWLIFVDHIGRSLSEYDKKQLSDAYSRPNAWDKIILIDTMDITNVTEL